MLVLSQAPQEAFGVWPENVESLNVFLACENKWIYLAIKDAAVRTGLCWKDVKTACWALKVKHRRRVFNDIRAMETAALEVFNGDEE